MKRFLLFVAVLFSPLSVILAQDIEDGYYRVHNKKTGRYVYVTDNTGSINFTGAKAEMGALQLWKDHSRTISDPASIIYLKVMGANDGGTYYNLMSQGTGVKQIIDYYVYIHYNSGYYQIYAEGKYLCDNETTDSPDGAMGTDRSGDYRKWIATRVDAQTDEWFGITPSIISDGRKLHPFYADFGFTCASEGMKVLYIMKVDKEGAVIKELTDNVIPAGTPVIIECSSSAPSDNKIDLVYSYDNKPSDNQLEGVYFNNPYRSKSADARKVFDKNTMRVLGIMSDGRIGYVLSKVAVDSKTKKQYLEANQSYLMVGEDIPDEIPVITESEYQAILARRAEEQRIADSIRVADSIAARIDRIVPDKTGHSVYMISGRNLGNLTKEEIEQLPAGIYIIDRRKVVIGR